MSSLEEVIRTSPVEVLPGRYAVVRLADPVPLDHHFLVCRDGDETTLIAPESQVPWGDVLAAETWFRLLAIRVSTPFAAPGFLARVTGAIAAHGLNVFVVSTFSKDYILLKEEDLDGGIAAMTGLGFEVHGASR